MGVPLPLDARLSPAAVIYLYADADRVGPTGGEMVPPRVGVGRLREGDQADGGQFFCRQRGDHQCVSLFSLSLSRGEIVFLSGSG